MEVEVGCYARAILDFDTNVSGELPLTIGDVVRVDKQIDQNWLHGSKFGGIQGMFPKSFVTKLLIPKLHNQQKLFIAIDTFPAQQAGDLGFSKGDAIVGIRKIDANWMEGEADGKRGIFPSSFAKEVPPPKINFVENTNGHSLPLSPSTVNRTNSGAIKAIVKTNLDAKLPDEIALKAGEIVYIDEYIDKNWCRGRTPDGRKGIFPKGFVEVSNSSQLSDSPHLPIIHSSPVRSVSPIVVSSTKLPSPVANYTSVVTNTTFASPTTSRAKISSEPQAKDEIQPYGRTKYSFAAEYPEELSFSPNQIVKLLKHIDEEWTLGELNGKRGIFPTSYIDIIADCSKSFENKPVSARSESEHEQYVVVCDFDGTVQGDLQARVNDRISLIKRINDDWIEGYNHRTNCKGLIPLNFLKQVVADTHVALRSTEGRKNYGQERPHSLDEAISNNLMRLDNSDRPLTPNVYNAQNSNKSSRQSIGVTYAQNLEHRQGYFEPKKDSFETKQATNHLYPAVNEIRHSPPARPTASPALKKPIQEDLEQQRRQQEEQKKLEVRAQRTRIFQEIITSERDYCNDLTICQDVFSTYRNALDVDILLAGLPSIVLLSKKLLHALEAEFARDFVYQEVGTPFLTMQEEFKHVYSGFCETHEDVQNLLDKYETEPPKQIVLKDCLHKIQQQTTCLDLSSLLSRPIQRVLKYPLFISEVLKCTEGNQSDKVKLMMALKVMTEVAQSINETKRRKEMVSKYRKDGETNFSERLSRLNMHTFRKKSSRFSVRLSSSIGLTQTIKDEDFDKTEREFHSVEKACRTFVRDVQVYCEQMLMFFNQQMSIAESLHHGIGAKSQKTETYFDAWSRTLFSEATLQKFFDSVSEKVRSPISIVQQTCRGPEKLIVKRRDKLLDLEAASSRYEKEKSRGESAEPSKLRTLEEEYRKAKVEYEAMNNQLKNELPQLCNLAYDILTMATKAFVAAQRSWVYDLGRQFQPLERLVGSNLVGFDAILEQFQKNNQFATNELTKLTFAPSGTTNVSGRSPTISKKSSITIEPITPVNKSNHIIFPQKPQNEADRQIMRTKYDDKKLYITTCAYHAQSDMDISLKPGDLVGVIVNKDPMGNSDRWFIDNGVGKGFVPCNILQKYVDESQQTAVNVNQIVKERPKMNSPVREVISAKPVKITDRFGGSMNKPPISAKPLNKPVMIRSLTESGNGIVSSTEQVKTIKEPMRPKIVPDRAAPSPPTVRQLQPIRSAPPPPVQQQRLTSTVSSSSPTTPDDEYKTVEKHSQKFVNDQEQVEFCLVKYDFSARSENELKLSEGHLVAVHAKQDLENNSDWWLVENEDGDIGYVPANYLQPYKD